jgi:hypothetical protein
MSMRRAESEMRAVVSTDGDRLARTSRDASSSDSVDQLE